MPSVPHWFPSELVLAESASVDCAAVRKLSLELLLGRREINLNNDGDDAIAEQWRA